MHQFSFLSRLLEACRQWGSVRTVLHINYKKKFNSTGEGSKDSCSLLNVLNTCPIPSIPLNFIYNSLRASCKILVRGRAGPSQPLSDCQDTLSSLAREKGTRFSLRSIFSQQIRVWVPLCKSQVPPWSAGDFSRTADLMYQFWLLSLLHHFAIRSSNHSFIWKNENYYYWMIIILLKNRSYQLIKQ